MRLRKVMDYNVSLDGEKFIVMDSKGEITDTAANRIITYKKKLDSIRDEA